MSEWLVSPTQRMDNKMNTDRAGNPIVYVVYDRARNNPSGGHWRSATFADPAEADQFLKGNPDRPLLYVSCQTPSERDYTLIRMRETGQ